MKHQERRQYIFTVFFTLIALAVMTAYNFFSFYSNAVSNMIAMGKSSLAQETEQLNGYIAKGMDVLQVTAITVEYMMQEGASPEALEAFLREESERYMAEIDPNFTGIYGLFQGNYLDGIGWVPDADYVPQEREWYIAAKEAAGRPTVVSPYLDAQTNTVMISVSQLLYDNESVISFDIVMDQIQIITQSINLDGMGYGFVIDKEGLVVAHSDETEKGKNYQENAKMEALLTKVYEDGAGTFDITLNEEDCTVFADTVSDDWHVIMIVSNTKLYHDIRNILFRNIAICIVVFVMVVFFCTWAFHKIGIHMRNAEESRKNVQKLNDTLLRTLARTIDAKDRYTNGHSQRVAKYVAAIAGRMGKSREEQQQFYDAALLHDVGKIHIPDAIINKPTRLTDEEFEYIKLHPVAGYCILRDIGENALIASAAKWHHERYDGKGYPYGLSGKNIPEVARIVGVADAYDAMTSNRSYRQIMSQEQVRSEIENGRGRQFDPEIADIMIEMIDEDKEYKLRQKTGIVTNILAVDDEPENLDRIEELLKDEPGYVVHRAVSGTAALKIMREMQVDIVLLDTQMPDMDGFELYAGIREITEVPVIFLTADKSVEVIEKINALCIEDYLVKPFMPQALLEILHSILQDKEGEENLR